MMDCGKFKPAETTTAAVREAMAKLFAAQQEAGQRLDDLQAARVEFEKSGNRAQAEQKAVEIAVVQRELRELEAVGEQLDSMFSEAVRIQAGKAAMLRVGDAQTAIERYNGWLAKNYEKHAKALAEGIALEQAALGHIQALRSFDEASAALPKLSLTFVGREGRSLSSLCRLPAAMPGAAIYWG
jgi:hypothetical protein